MGNSGTCLCACVCVRVCVRVLYRIVTWDQSVGCWISILVKYMHRAVSSRDEGPVCGCVVQVLYIFFYLDDMLEVFGQLLT